ncbi:hypothetical protein [Sphingomonas sp. 22176]|uniref:hypothetical protein n=1 Tax=Sphingomonas sp. 22176 TaxID=3453884 RepID=UPI003F84805F
MLDKMRRVNQAEIVETERLSAALAVAAATHAVTTIIATNRMFGRCAASQIASASMA